MWKVLIEAHFSLCLLEMEWKLKNWRVIYPQNPPLWYFWTTGTLVLSLMLNLAALLITMIMLILLFRFINWLLGCEVYNDTFTQNFRNWIWFSLKEFWNMYIALLEPVLLELLQQHSHLKKWARIQYDGDNIQTQKMAQTQIDCKHSQADIYRNYKQKENMDTH